MTHINLFTVPKSNTYTSCEKPENRRQTRGLGGKKKSAAYFDDSSDTRRTEMCAEIYAKNTIANFKKRLDQEFKKNQKGE